MTTFLPAAAATSGWAASPPTAMTEASAAIAMRRNDPKVRRPDALWAPWWDTGNALASSPPEHRAWGAVTVGVAAGDRREHADARRGARSAGMGAIGRSSDRVARPAVEDQPRSGPRADRRQGPAGAA